ncbi:hypothetical protein [Actinopolymorpha sp. B9G3]|uniref:hypothetical protein n=1 Tax=Actinopolymorpha sp. B9G3 TaxID=3158970 RepID=UPI0032D95848
MSAFFARMAARASGQEVPVAVRQPQPYETATDPGTGGPARGWLPNGTQHADVTELPAFVLPEVSSETRDRAIDPRFPDRLRSSQPAYGVPSHPSAPIDGGRARPGPAHPPAVLPLRRTTPPDVAPRPGTDSPGGPHPSTPLIAATRPERDRPGVDPSGGAPAGSELDGRRQPLAQEASTPTTPPPRPAGSTPAVQQQPGSRRRQQPRGAPEPASQAASAATSGEPLSAARRATGNTRPPVPDLATLLRTHVLPHLADRGAVSRDEIVVVDDTPNGSPARHRDPPAAGTVSVRTGQVRSHGSEASGPRADRGAPAGRAAPEVNVHIDRVVVTRAPAPPPTPAPVSPPTPRSGRTRVDHAGYLTRRRERG